ncbi:MAG: PTS sugar transporter [Candidatus Lambdaproteobacteria bacterium]|nr:PTS sugar transporter [Candidatus Lambdaproteobacteria bacterium]
MQAHPIGLIIATHGGLAAALAETAAFILDRPTTLSPFTFEAGEEPRASFQRLEALVRRCDRGAGVIILVDLFGGTPGSLALSMLKGKAIEVITGVNLPMALAAATMAPGLSLREASAAIVRAGHESIREAGRLLGG